MTSNDTAKPTVTEVRTALIREAADYGERRRAHHKAMRAIQYAARQNNPHFDAMSDAYEGFATSGGYAQTLAAALRILAARDPKTADELAALIHEVMENGDDCLDGPNDDIWLIVEAEKTAAPTAPDGR